MVKPLALNLSVYLTDKSLGLWSGRLYAPGHYVIKRLKIKNGSSGFQGMICKLAYELLKSGRRVFSFCQVPFHIMNSSRTSARRTTCLIEICSENKLQYFNLD